MISNKLAKVMMVIVGSALVASPAPAATQQDAGPSFRLPGRPAALASPRSEPGEGVSQRPPRRPVDAATERGPQPDQPPADVQRRGEGRDGFAGPRMAGPGGQSGPRGRGFVGPRGPQGPQGPRFDGAPRARFNDAQQPPLADRGMGAGRGQQEFRRPMMQDDRMGRGFAGEGPRRREFQRERRERFEDRGIMQRPMPDQRLREGAGPRKGMGGEGPPPFARQRAMRWMMMGERRGFREGMMRERMRMMDEPQRGRMPDRAPRADMGRGTQRGGDGTENGESAVPSRRRGMDAGGERSQPPAQTAPPQPPALDAPPSDTQAPVAPNPPQPPQRRRARPI